MDQNSVNLQASGAVNFRLISANSTNLTCITNGPGCVFAWSIANTNATARCVKFYDAPQTGLAVPVVGTTVPVRPLWIPPASHITISEMVDGWVFYNGLWVATTVNIADTDSTAVGANDLVINISYRSKSLAGGMF